MIRKRGRAAPGKMSMLYSCKQMALQCKYRRALLTSKEQRDGVQRSIFVFEPLQQRGECNDIKRRMEDIKMDQRIGREPVS